MTVIPPIPPISTATQLGPTGSIGAAGGVGGPGGVGATDPGATQRADDFGQSVIDALDQLQRTTDELSRQAATGDLARPEDLMVASSETQLLTQLTVAVRNRALESFNDIMRMQL